MINVDAIEEEWGINVSFMLSWFLIFIVFNHPFLIAKEFEKIPRDGIWIHEGKTLFISIS
jgi:hypothetical protein